MDDTDISSHVNNLEPEGLSARDDARIVDAEMTAFKSADIATVGNLSASITAMNQSLISRQFAVVCSNSTYTDFLRENPS